MWDPGPNTLSNGSNWFDQIISSHVLGMHAIRAIPTILGLGNLCAVSPCMHVQS